MSLIGITSALAADVVTVTPTNTQGWTTADTRPGGAVTFVSDPTSPYPSGALQMTTDATTTAKAQYLHGSATPLAQVTQASYYTKQVSASFAGGDPSYQLPSCLLGGSTSATCGFTTLVFEPYQNPLEGLVVPNIWQKWDVAKGLFWSTRTVVCSNGTIAGTSGGPASYTLAQVKAACPQAVVIQFGVNIGSNNPSYVVRTDGFNFNGTVYDFQLTDEEQEGNNNEQGDKTGDKGGDKTGDKAGDQTTDKSNEKTGGQVSELGSDGPHHGGGRVSQD